MSARVTYPSQIDDDQLRTLYQTADVGVFCLADSTANNAILEAMSCGVPIVATDVGGMKEYLGKDTGILCGPGNAKEVADGLRLILGNQSIATRMSAASRQRAEMFDYRIVSDKLRSMYIQSATFESHSDLKN